MKRSIVFLVALIPGVALAGLPNMNGDETIQGVLVRHCDLDFPSDLRETASLNEYNFFFQTDASGTFLIARKKQGRLKGFRRSIASGLNKKSLYQHVVDTVTEMKKKGLGHKKLIVVYKIDKGYAYCYAL